MPEFRYRAVTPTGRTVDGRDVFRDADDLARQLRRKRQRLVSAREIRRKAVPEALLAALVRHLARLVASGVPLDRALGVLERHGEGRGLKPLAASLRARIKDGLPLSRALEEAGRLDPLVVPLVRAGEESGELAEALGRIDAHLAARARLRRELLASLAYPAVLSVTAVLALVFISGWIVPIFEDLFVGRADAMPALTAVVFAFSDALTRHGLTAAVLLAAVIALGGLALRRSDELRLRVDAALLRLPGIGSFVGDLEQARLFQVLGVLLVQRVAVARALALAADVVHNTAIAAAVRDGLEEVRRGVRVHRALACLPRLDGETASLLEVGEETGRLGPIAVEIGEDLAGRVQSRVKTLSALAEPAIILVLGGIVGTVVTAMLLGVYTMTDFSGL